MNLGASTRLLFLLTVTAVCTTMLHASAISGSLPFFSINVSETGGGNLKTATTFSTTDDRTSGHGSGDFALVRLDTSFGAFSLTDTAVSSGGGFSISNPGYGSFTATGGDIVAESADALVVDLTGTYTPGPLLGGVTPSPAHTTLAFTQRGSSVSASFTLETSGTPIPEPGTLATMGMGLCGTAVILRRKWARCFKHLQE